jgi:hypothetical protein
LHRKGNPVNRALGPECLGQILDFNHAIRLLLPRATRTKFSTIENVKYDFVEF